MEYDLDHLDRYTVLLRDGETTATIYPILSPSELPEGLLAFLCDEINMEIDRGETFPFFDPLDIEQFLAYWFSNFAAVMILGDSATLEGPKQWEKECLGSFLIKPNFPGRSGHICTGTFLVNAGIRGKGIGRTLAECFALWAPRLGFTYCLFNLIFETNVAIRKILESSNFKRVGRLRAAAILKGHEVPVDALMYGKELVSNADPTVGAYRFDKIKYYLETGKYPAMADRAEKSRLRSASSHYRIQDGKLMLRDKEVVSDPVRQIQICLEMHVVSHGGINKTTSMVAEKYHWARIKDTVAAAIKGCTQCRDQTRDPPPSTRRPPGVRKLQAKYPKVLRSHPNNPNARIKRVEEEIGNSLLSHDLTTLDDNIMAAVEAAQRSEMRTSYAEAAALGYIYYDKRDQASEPEQDQQGYENRHEIEIARALIQANEDGTKPAGEFNEEEM